MAAHSTAVTARDIAERTGEQLGVIDHLNIGDGLQIGAVSVALNDIPAGQLIRGAPAQELTRLGREQVALKKLPYLLKAVRRLEERVQELERERNSRI
jgi:UDP-3-O-[3-hydroxymyristoyl] glucosamine N-acyltransferase